MMKVSTLFLHGGEIWEINSLNYHTPLVQYMDWPSVKEEEGREGWEFNASESSKRFTADLKRLNI